MSDADAVIDRQVPHAARIYDYLVGGTTHYEVDRHAAHAAGALVPGGFEVARARVQANRHFLVRAVKYLAQDAGLRQFLDIGTGIPGSDNVHAVAQAVAPDVRVVYVDNDPAVLAHARDLLEGDGSTHYIDGDIRVPAKILREARHTLDFEQPIAVVLNAILHFVPDNDQPRDIVDQFVAAVPSGSHLVISHLSDSIPEHAEAVRAVVDYYNNNTNETWVSRTYDEIGQFFEGLYLVPPGIVPIDQWRPDQDDPLSSYFFGGVARKA